MSSMSLTSRVEDLATATPVEIDTELYWLLVERSKVEFTIETSTARLHNADPDYAPHQALIQNLQEILRKAHAELERLGLRIRELDGEFAAREGWSRAYFVTNSNGHIHTSTSCTTCFPSTQFRFLPQVSGWTMEEIIEEAGEKACTVCFPGAPVNVLARASRLEDPLNRQEREARQAERAAKAAEKAVKAITAPDGTALRDGHGMVVKTERTAEIYYVDAAASAVVWSPEGTHYLYGQSYGSVDEAEWTARQAENHAEYAATAQRLLEALAAKRGTSVEDQRAALALKVSKKLKRDYLTED
jgi:hypothetical protein